MLDGKCDCIARKHVLYNGKQSRFQVGKKFIPLLPTTTTTTTTITTTTTTTTTTRVKPMDHPSILFSSVYCAWSDKKRMDG